MSDNCAEVNKDPEKRLFSIITWCGLPGKPSNEHFPGKKDEIMIIFICVCASRSTIYRLGSINGT